MRVFVDYVTLLKVSVQLHIFSKQTTQRGGDKSLPAKVIYFL